jgi:hypothetical protein
MMLTSFISFGSYHIIPTNSALSFNAEAKNKWIRYSAAPLP